MGWTWHGGRLALAVHLFWWSALASGDRSSLCDERWSLPVRDS